MFDRLLELISINDIKKIGNAKILLVGVGGVGGYALESLVRSGFKNISIIDGDVISISNLNRQIIAKMTNIDKFKVEEAKTRSLEINSDVKINTMGVYLNEDNFNDFVNENYDYIIDACDDILVKILLLKYAKAHNIKIITSLGTGRKFDPSKLQITTLNKTFNDPLAKKLRNELRKQNIDLNIPVVFSSEEAINTGNVIGSAIFVPATAGILLANYVFKDILKKS
ncbi:MAG: tRNA threonylcarbamoyladenosine dehydratase [Bacilli bacterium]|jgi:tRNA A37 threonylcarbamoyladenosine dehydratase|nr:tRNA threonylcarbamoyladenosine dehydratase [Bacilli bacterium]